MAFPGDAEWDSVAELLQDGMGAGLKETGMSLLLCQTHGHAILTSLKLAAFLTEFESWKQMVEHTLGRNVNRHLFITFARAVKVTATLNWVTSACPHSIPYRLLESAPCLTKQGSFDNTAK